MNLNQSRQSGPAFGEADRAATSVLAGLERRLLIWIARRLPPWLNSDHLTAIALAAMTAAGVSFWAARFHRDWLFAVVACLGLNWFGDSLDGTVARVRQQQRPRYGFYVDHIVDCVGAVFLFMGMGFSGFMSPAVAVGLLVVYLLLSIDAYLAAYCVSVFRLAFWGIGPTELRILLASGALALRYDPYVTIMGTSVQLFDFAGLIAIAAMSATLIVSVGRNVRTLYRAEPLRRPEQAARPPAPGMPIGRRGLIFMAVGAMGVILQLALLWALTAWFEIGYLVATAIAVEAVVLHNFLWHVEWTWSDRASGGKTAAAWRLARFHLTTGAVSIAGNLAVTMALVRFTGCHYVVANAIAIAVCSGATFLLNHRLVFVTALLLVSVAPAGTIAHAAELSPAAAAAFDRTARSLEARLDEERAGTSQFLWIDRLPAGQQRDARARLARGETMVSRLPAPAGQEASLQGAMVHHWVGTTLISGASVDRIVRLMQDYDRYEHVYRPAVKRSRAIARDGDRFTVSLQLYTRRVVGVTLNTESSIWYRPAGRSRMQVLSVSTRIAEVQDAGEAGEREVAIGHDNGFLWRFNNYCSIEGQADGTLVQCETLSLTRDTPFGLGWLIRPLVESIPRDSLEFTLETMRTAILRDRE